MEMSSSGLRGMKEIVGVNDDMKELVHISKNNRTKVAHA